MKAINQLRTFQRILDEYTAETPLGKFVASRLLYNYFRLGKALPNLPIEERLNVAEFLCNTQVNSYLQHFKPEWAACMAFTLDEKIALVKAAYHDFNLNDVFPWIAQVSDGIDKKAFLKSFFIQPDLFIRVHKGSEHTVKTELAKADIPFKDEGNNCLALPNGTRLEAIFPNQHLFEVQDHSSQQTANYFKPEK